MDGDHPIEAGGDPLVTDMATTMASTIVIQGDIVPRGSGGPGTIPMMPGQETGLPQMTVQDPQLKQPTGPIMSIPTGMAMYIARMEMTSTG